MSTITRRAEIVIEPNARSKINSCGNSGVKIPRFRFFLAAIGTVASIGAVFLTPRRAQADTIQDGDIVIDNISGASDTIVSNHGSVTITNKIDDHSNVTIRAATFVRIGQKVDQHSRATISAGTDVTIGQKIDQHSIAHIQAGGSINIGQKVDQHSQAYLYAPSGNITVQQGVDQHSWVHWQSKSANIPNLGNGSRVDNNLNAPEESMDDCC
ncbi:MAG: hypothetical protein WB681_08030 [Candidatus Cybelea sp.]